MKKKLLAVFFIFLYSFVTPFSVMIEEKLGVDITCSQDLCADVDEDAEKEGEEKELEKEKFELLFSYEMFLSDHHLQVYKSELVNFLNAGFTSKFFPPPKA